jgi:hypothetical protein
LVSAVATARTSVGDALETIRARLLIVYLWQPKAAKKEYRAKPCALSDFQGFREGAKASRSLMRQGG